VAVRAIQNASIQNTPATLKRDRQQIRNQLEAINRPEVAVKGLGGDIYFSVTHDSAVQIRFGQFVGKSLISAATQLSPVKHLELVNLEEEIKAGNIIPFTDARQKQQQYFWRQEVVYAGIDINKLSRVEQSKSSFTGDFYFWLRYAGSSDATRIEFPTGVANSLDPNLPLFDPEKPTHADVIDGLNYRLYQIQGEFRNNYDFHDYPFDQQALKLNFVNPRIPSERLIYVVDTLGLKLLKPDPEELKKPYQSLQLWNFKNILYAQETFSSTSTRGKPRLFNANLQVDYPGLSATITLQRRFSVFLVKALLPLALLVLVLFGTLFFSENLVKERLTVAISTMLSSAVLLTAINSQLADTGYTVAIEYGFYLYFCLCLFCVLFGLIVERLHEVGRKTAIRSLSTATQILYMAIVLSTIATYWVAFGARTGG
jgi:branched-chain amino acid transport system substrate-binding protein